MPEVGGDVQVAEADSLGERGLIPPGDVFDIITGFVKLKFVSRINFGNAKNRTRECYLCAMAMQSPQIKMFDSFA